MTMTLSAKGAEFIRLHEGFVGGYYRDPVGIPTIGIGFTWRSMSFRKWWADHKRVPFAPGATMTREEADAALQYLAGTEYGRDLNRFLDREVPQHIFDGMLSVVFNCGAGALHWSWAAACRDGQFGAAAARLRNTAVTAGGKRLPGLVRRREEEALLIEQGVYSGVKGDRIETPGVAIEGGELRLGDRGVYVAALIRDLAALGYYHGILDDRFGHGTQSAVIIFQEQNGLLPDGIAGPLTLKAIEAARAVP